MNTLGISELILVIGLVIAFFLTPILIIKLSKNSHEIPANLELASQLKRLINFIIDSFILLVIYFLVSLINFYFNIPNNEIYLENILYFFYFKLLILIAIPIIYYIIFEFFFQKTLAKYITKTRVVNLKNEKPSFKEILIRTFCRLIPMEYISFLFSNQGVHDKLSNTVVIKDL